MAQGVCKSKKVENHCSKHSKKTWFKEQLELIPHSQKHRKHGSYYALELPMAFWKPWATPEQNKIQHLSRILVLKSTPCIKVNLTTSCLYFSTSQARFPPKILNSMSQVPASVSLGRSASTFPMAVIHSNVPAWPLLQEEGAYRIGYCYLFKHDWALYVEFPWSDASLQAPPLDRTSGRGPNNPAFPSSIRTSVMIIVLIVSNYV